MTGKGRRRPAALFPIGGASLRESVAASAAVAAPWKASTIAADDSKAEKAAARREVSLNWM